MLTLTTLLAARAVTYTLAGHSGETLRPARWDDGSLSWQVTAADGGHAGHWTLPQGAEDQGCLGAYDRPGEWTVVPPTAEHLQILEAHAAPHRGDLRILVGGVPYEGGYGPGYRPILVIRSPGWCWHCGAEMPPAQAEPVTIGGWYDGRRYRWDSGRLVLADVRCVACPEPEPQLGPSREVRR